MTKKITPVEGIAQVLDLDKQEGLTIQKLNLLEPSERFKNRDLTDKFVNRPKDSFLQLMNWTEENFGQHLRSHNHLNKFIHNKIIIEGQFLQFCKERKIEIECALKDSIVSWKTDSGNEKFFMQGIFFIRRDKLEFIHAALFQKGNQNEDEISFFVLLNNDNVEEYIKFRNEYDEWSQKRDRSNLQIRVIDGDDIPYERDMKWDDIFLPESLKVKIKLSVEGFLKSKHIYESKKIPWKRGILLWGQPGNGKTSLIRTMISNYDFKPVTILPNANDDSIRDAFAYAQEQNPALLFFEDLDSLLKNINMSSFLNLMDGIAIKNGLLVIATSNSLDALAANIKNRPSRFDRKFEIPLPDEEMAFKYLKYWFNKILQDKDIRELAIYAVKYNFSYAYLKELYVSAIHNAISDDREEPTSNDIKLALEQLMDDKFKKDGKVIGIDKYINNKNSSKKK